MSSASNRRDLFSLDHDKTGVSVKRETEDGAGPVSISMPHAAEGDITGGHG